MELFIRNLPYAVTARELEEIFAAFGDVTNARVVTDRETGESRGFGFIKFAHKRDAMGAIAALNETEFHGRIVYVQESRPKVGG